jgi:hypothetical protein
LGLFDEACATVVLSFGKIRSWEEKQAACNLLDRAVRKSNSFGQKITHDLVRLQQQITEVFIEMEIPFQQALDVLTKQENARAVALQLLRLGRADLCVEVRGQAKISLEEVMMKLVQSFPSPCVDMGPFKQFPRSIERSGEAAYRMVIRSYFRALIPVFQDLAKIKQLIKETTLDSVKGHLFCDFDFLEEAFDVARKIRDTQLIETIRKKARGRPEMFPLCTKIKTAGF